MCDSDDQDMCLQGCPEYDNCLIHYKNNCDVCGIEVDGRKIIWGKEVKPNANRHYCFCSEKCRDLFLGKILGEEDRIDKNICIGYDIKDMEIFKDILINLNVRPTRGAEYIEIGCKKKRFILYNYSINRLSIFMGNKVFPGGSIVAEITGVVHTYVGTEKEYMRFFIHPGDIDD